LDGPRRRNLAVQVDRLKGFRLKVFRNQACVLTHSFGHLRWLMVLTQVDRLKIEAFSLNP
jgi:hypothetical protein